MFPHEGDGDMYRVVKSTLGQPPVPALLELFLNTLSSRARLQTQLTSEGGQIPGKERWLN